MFGEIKKDDQDLLEKGKSKTVLQNNEESISPWEKYRDLNIHQKFFKFGIPVIKPDYIKINPVVETKLAFKDRTLSFYKPGKTHGHSQEKPDTILFKRAESLVSKLTKFSLKDNPNTTAMPNESGPVFFNKNEVFFPVILKSKVDNPPIGVYLHPWVSKRDKEVDFSGFRQYFTAGQMFGSNLKAIDQHGNSFQLINYDIDFFPEQKIKHVIYDGASNPYDQTLFDEFEKIAKLIDMFSKSDGKQLSYYLPYYEYVLLGVKLFVQGRLDFSALENFLNIIFEKKDEHIKKITEICQSHGIAVVIESSLESIFRPLDGKLKTAKNILERLNVTLNETSHSGKGEQNTGAHEKNLVQYCLIELQKNLPENSQGCMRIWEDFTKNKEIINLQELLKIARTVMLTNISTAWADYETCSILSFSEKSIQINHDSLLEGVKDKPVQKLSNNNNFDNKEDLCFTYPEVFHINTFPTLLSYDYNSQGLLQNFGYCQATLSDFISRGGLKYASQNVAYYKEKVCFFSSKVQSNQSIQQSNSEVYSGTVEPTSLKDVLLLKFK